AETWHHDGGGFAGAIRIALLRIGDTTPSILLPHHAFSPHAATVRFTADGSSDYELHFIANTPGHRTRLNGLRLRATGTPTSPPGTSFVDADNSNTIAADDGPSPFWTDGGTDPGFTSGPLWRRRSGLGFDLAGKVGDRGIFEKDANGG